MLTNIIRWLGIINRLKKQIFINTKKDIFKFKDIFRNYCSFL